MLPTISICNAGQAPMTPADYAEIARLHAESIPTGFLSTLGGTFLSRLYRGIAGHPGSCLLVARDAQGSVAGFVSGTLSVKKCYRAILRKRFLSLGLPVALKMLLPANLKRMFETLRYPAGEKAGASTETELLSIAVSDRVRGQGVGKMLVAELEAWFAAKGHSSAYKVVTWAEDPRSNGFYAKTGFVFSREFVHHGNRMNEYVKQMPLKSGKA